MRGEEWIEIFRSIPEERHASLVMSLTNGSEISVDCLFRFEETFVVVRGRLGGTTDDNRVFFIPYDRVQYIRIDRALKLEEMVELLGESHTSAGNVRSANLDGQSVIAAAERPAPAMPAAAVPAGTEAMAHRNALLERIRAARLTSGGNPGK